ncbi:hypothetical protein C0992_009108 [Termitomyces sp. T32_za158]|nr:hypothetical protein C0992_009108 [Termitomyces sp. T32_za158]
MPDLSDLKFLIDTFKLTPRTRMLFSSGGLAALVIIFHFVYRRKQNQKYVSNLAHIGVRQFDVIVVGGGTAGCALAARLSEDPSIDVLLLEAGQSGTALIQSRTPALFSRLYNTKHVLPFRTQPQLHANGRTQFWPRAAKLLGGCSSINAQMAQYGAPEDFDQWAKLMNDDSWSWKNFSQFVPSLYLPPQNLFRPARRYFTKFERYQPHPDYPLVDTAVRGTSGPIRIGYFNLVSETSKAFIKACTSIGIPFTPDFNVSSGTLGVSRRQRVSSESAYLTKDVLARKNLTVAINAQVTRHDRSLKYFRPTGLLDALKIFFASIQYYLLGTGGPLATNFGESAAFVRSDDPILFPKEQYPETLSDSTSGPGAPDLELFSTPLAYKVKIQSPPEGSPSLIPLIFTGAWQNRF